MKPINNADFGKTADDYLTHQAGFLKSLLEKLQSQGIGIRNQGITDFGAGTGSLSLGFAANGSQVTGIDPPASMLDAARKVAVHANLAVQFQLASAEQTQLLAKSMDIVAAGQCWHWFNRPAACKEIARILKPSGKIVVAYYDWLPLRENLVRQTEQLIEKFNPQWKGGNQLGIHPQICGDLGEAGFNNIESLTYDVPAQYTHEGWRGRIRASAGVGATMDQATLSAFDAELKQRLEEISPDDKLLIPHRVFILIASPPC